jgi:hypothetical protein
LLAGLADEAEEIFTFGSRAVSGNQNNQADMRSFCSELKEVVAITSNHHTLIALRGRKHIFVRSGAREELSEPDNFMLMPFESVLDRGGNVVIEEEFQFPFSSICGSASRSISA